MRMCDASFPSSSSLICQVFVNTACDFDGSDAGAKPDEAISWGKIKMDAEPVKVYGDASFIFPLLVAETFAILSRNTSNNDA
mmetsp:Transcript_38847/g.62250  ORF Transcript_38847/g.62250 Transcript_38847/m.62250 type:complete len:82 (-) Transcript_38847:137-382(-)